MCRHTLPELLLTNTPFATCLHAMNCIEHVYPHCTEYDNTYYSGIHITRRETDTLPYVSQTCQVSLSSFLNDGTNNSIECLSLLQNLLEMNDQSKKLYGNKNSA